MSSIALIKAISKKEAITRAAANFQGMTFKETHANGDTVHTIEFLKSGVPFTYDLLTHGGVDSFLGEYRLISDLRTAHPTSVETRFAVLNDKIDATHPTATGVVSIATWDDTAEDWVTTKLNQAIPVGTSGDTIGFSGSTDARLALLSNADWNNKEFFYLDTDLHTMMLYKPNCTSFLQYEGQVVGTVAPLNPVNGDIWLGTERVYTWDDTNKFWKVVLSSYVRKHQPVQGSYTSHQLNGAELRVHRDTSDNMWISVYQNVGMDALLYSLDDNASAKKVLALNDEYTIVPSNIDKGVEHVLTTELAYDGKGQSVRFIRYDNTIFIVTDSKILVGENAFVKMETSERLLFLADITKTKEKIVFDTDLKILLQFIPNAGHDGSFIEFRGQAETGTFPYSGLTNGITHDSNGKSYTYNLTKGYWSYAGAAPLKNNMTASAPPTVNDDSNDGYSVGSIWIYNSITYILQDATDGAAIWVSDADITYFDDWTAAVAAISVAGSTYVNKYISVTNANGGPSSGTTYAAPGAIPTPIADGGTAVYKVLAQGANYSVTCQKRAITNPILTGMVNAGAALPSVAGYYGFLGVPTGGYPSGIAFGDIGFYDGATWSRFQSYANAPNSILVGSGASQIVWAKQSGIWSNAYTRVTLANQTVNGSLTASTTVDIAEFIEINQTTVNISIAIPNPTITVNPRRLIIMNTGTATLFISNLIYSALLNPNDFITLIWSPSKNTWIVPETQYAERYWQPNTRYMLNYKVVYGATIFMPRIDHVSSADFITDFQAGKWSIVGGAELYLDHAQRIGITLPFAGMRVYQFTDYLYGLWEYDAIVNNWKYLDINNVLPTIITSIMAKPTYDGVFLFVGTPADGLPVGTNGTINNGSLAYRTGGVWYKGVAYNALPASIHCFRSGGLETWVKKNSSGWESIAQTKNEGTKAQREALTATATEGYEFYQTDNGKGKYVYSDGAWNRISNLAYVYAGNETSVNPVVGTIFNFSLNVVSRGIKSNDGLGKYTLYPGTYDLTAVQLISENDAGISYKWYNATTGSDIGTLGNSADTIGSAGTASPAAAILECTVDTQVYVRCVNDSATNTATMGNWMKIVQIS